MEHPAGDTRRSCPAFGKYATVTCYRRPGQVAAPTTIDLNMPLLRTEHTLPAITPPARDTEAHPDICTKQSITVPASVHARWRQKNILFGDEWQKAWSGLRSQNEGGNGNLKRHCQDNIANPGARLSHGRVAQTLLTAIIIFVANYRTIVKFFRTRAVNAMREARGLPPKTTKPNKPRSLNALPPDQLVWVDQKTESPPDLD